MTCWGKNDFGQLGNNGQEYPGTPPVTTQITNVIALAAAYNATCALKQDRTVWCWGLNGYNSGDLGTASMADEVHVPEPVMGISDATAIAMGETSSAPCARAARCRAGVGMRAVRLATARRWTPGPRCPWWGCRERPGSRP